MRDDEFFLFVLVIIAICLYRQELSYLVFHLREEQKQILRERAGIEIIIDIQPLDKECLSEAGVRRDVTHLHSPRGLFREERDERRIIN